jgi:hypothetical protein
MVILSWSSAVRGNIEFFGEEIICKKFINDQIDRLACFLGACDSNPECSASKRVWTWLYSWAPRIWTNYVQRHYVHDSRLAEVIGIKMSKPIHMLRARNDFILRWRVYFYAFGIYTCELHFNVGFLMIYDSKLSMQSSAFGWNLLAD